jgi:hypothetical protein
MRWNNESHLELIEQVAETEGMISCEEELSEMFDRDIAPLVIEQYGEDDQPAMNEAFNNWSDGLTKDGQLHPLQYDTYVYCGNHA